MFRDEELYHNSILPMAMHIRGCRQMIVGTPKSGSKLFKKLWLLGQDPLQKDWKSFTLTAWENPLTDKRELSRYSKLMPTKTYDQEIMGRFVDEGGVYFEGLEGLFDPAIVSAPDPSGVYVIGVDLGKKSDFTVAWVGNVQKRCGVKCDRFNKLVWPSTVKRLAALSLQYNGARIMVDATGLGDVVLDDLRVLGMKVRGLILNNAVKAELAGTLNADIAYGRLQCVPDDVTRSEMEVFEQTVLPSGMIRLEAPPMYHDDCVVALALMNHALGRPSDGETVFVRH